MKAHSLEKMNKKQHKKGVKENSVFKKKNQKFKSTKKVPLVESNAKQQNGKNDNEAQKGKNKKQFANNGNDPKYIFRRLVRLLSKDYRLVNEGTVLHFGFPKEDQKQKLEDQESKGEEVLNSENESTTEDSNDSMDDMDSSQTSHEDDDDDDLKSDDTDEDDDIGDDDDLKSDDGDEDYDDDTEDDTEDMEDEKLDDLNKDDEDHESDDGNDVCAKIKAILAKLISTEVNEEDDEDSTEVDEDSIDDEDNYEDDKKDDEEEKSSLGFVSENDDEDDEDNDDEEEKSSLGFVSENDDEDDEDNDDEDKDDESDDISGESDDNEDEDDDISEKNDDSEAQNNESIKESKLKGKEHEEKKEGIRSRIIYISNIPQETSIADIRKLFTPYGDIQSILIKEMFNEVLSSMKKKLFLNVLTSICFKNENSAKEALALNGHKLGKHRLIIDLAKPKSPPKDKKKSVFLGNLPFEVTEEEVREHFASCGKIDSIHVLREYTGLSRGIGYVNFEHEDSVDLAIELNGSKVKGRNIRVQICTPATKSKKRHFGNKEGAQKNPQKKMKMSEGKSVPVKNEKGKYKQKRSQSKVKKEKPANSESRNSSLEKNEKEDHSEENTMMLRKKSKVKKLDKLQKTSKTD